MSADNIKINTVGEYNFYSIFTDGKKYVAGGVGNDFKEEYFREAKDADGIILLTSKPEFVGGLEDVLAQNPEIAVYATSAGLRNTKEIVNRSFNECLIKDGAELDGIRFIITPNVHWVDTAMVLYNDSLISGEMFSGGEGVDAYYNENLKVNRSFVESALDRLAGMDIDMIYPAIGKPQKAIELIPKMRELVKTDENNVMFATVLYSSTYGFTKKLAEKAYECLKKECSVCLIDAKITDKKEAIAYINKSDMLIVGTNTINRNAPQEIWEIVTGIDLVNKRGMPYFVFGSFGWAGDGIKLIDKTLSAMSLRQIVKPVDVLFKPTEDVFMRNEKGVNKIVEHSKGTDR